MSSGVAILGSTGSVGTQALEVISLHLDRFRVVALVANQNVKLLLRQAWTFRPLIVGVVDERAARQAEKEHLPPGTRLVVGAEALPAGVEHPAVDTVLFCLSGFRGAGAVVEALHRGRRVALATKEIIVCAGHVLRQVLQEKEQIVPVDSEHSALWQCLLGEDPHSIETLYLTASGGPFRTRTPHQLKDITPQQALQHPIWSMGSKITIDSATLMNKVLEVIEANWFFNQPPERIKVLIHPQSIVHGMVAFRDGTVKACLSVPDMRASILYALSHPQRLELALRRLDASLLTAMDFYEPEGWQAETLSLAYEVLKIGGSAPCILNSANETAVEAFLAGRVDFPGIVEVVKRTLEAMPPAPWQDNSIEEVEAVAQQARAQAYQIVEQLSRPRRWQMA